MANLKNESRLVESEKGLQNWSQGYPKEAVGGRVNGGPNYPKPLVWQKRSTKKVFDQFWATKTRQDKKDTKLVIIKVFEEPSS